MSNPDTEEATEARHPRETQELFGHADAEQTLLEAYRGGRIPHAWLIGGPRGIGKATLAYRMARFVLAHPDPNAGAVKAARTLAVDAEHVVARRIAAQAQPDLLVLERTVGDRGKLRQDIAVDDVRRSVAFFGSTAGEGGWRIAVVSRSAPKRKPSFSHRRATIMCAPPSVPLSKAAPGCCAIASPIQPACTRALWATSMNA